MSRKSAYKQVLSIGAAVVLGFALFTGSLDGAPKLLSPQSDEQAAALAEKQNENPSRTDNEADLVARLESGTAISSDSQNSQDAGDGSDSAATDTGDDASAGSAATPIDEVETPISTAPAAYISAAFPTTPATPTLPFVPTARTRSARRHSHSMNTSALQKRVALRSSPSSTAWAAPAKRSPAWAPNHSVKASAAISRVSIPLDGASSATTLFRARASTTAATLSPGRSAAKTPTAKISSPARAISTKRACCRLRSRFSTIFAIRATMCSTASRPCITKRNLSAVACALRRNRSRTTARPSASTYIATTCSRTCRSTTPPVATRHPETSADRATRNPKMICFPPSPRDQKGPPWVTQSGPCIGIYVAGNATRYLARPSS